jgi:hypothetical protein
VLALVTLFVSLYPQVMVSSSSFADSLTVQNASSAHYSLTVMTVVAVILTPIILLYEAWTYHVFRARLGREQMHQPARPARPPGGPDAGVDDARPQRIDPRLLRRTRGSRLALAVDAVLGLVAALLVLAERC